MHLSIGTDPPIFRGMIQNHAPTASAMTADELHSLQKTFDAICEQRGLIKGSSSAANVARELVDLYQSGIRDRRQLVSMLTGDGVFP